MKIRAIALALGIASILPPAQADETLAARHHCVMCHELDKKFIGPAFQDVARKYQGQPDAAAALYEKVRKGGAGVWGPVRMPPNGAVPSGDVRKLVDWVLKSG